MPITDIALPLRHGMLYKNQSQVLQKCLTTTQETSYVGSGNKRLSNDAKDQKICELEKEVLELQRSNDILKEALGFFAVSRKK